MSAPQLTWRTSAYSPDGYADEARSFLRALERSGRSPALWNFRWTEQTVTLSAAEGRRLRAQERRFAGERTRPAVIVNHCMPGQFSTTYQPQALHVARLMFETDRLPEGWMVPLMHMDEIWVPSDFNVETFERAGVNRERLRVLPGTLDFDVFDPHRPDLHPLPVPGVPSQATTFLSTFDFSERKGWRQLLTAWAQAFTSTDPVCLLLKASSFYHQPGYVRSRVDAFLDGVAPNGTAPVVVFDELLSAADMPRLYAAADAFVLPSRGEGWGRPYMEALAMGVPTVASDWSAQRAFVKPEYAWLVPGELVTVPENVDMVTDIYNGHRWFEPDVAELVSVLRAIASDPAAARTKAAAARPRLMEDFDEHAIADRIGDLSDDLWQRKERLARKASVRVACQVVRPDPALPATAAAIGRSAPAVLDRRLQLMLERDDLSLPDSEGFTFDFSVDERTPGVRALLACRGFRPSDRWVERARRTVDLVLVADPNDAQHLIERGLPYGRVMTVAAPAEDRATSALVALRDLAASPVAPVRTIASAQLESHHHLLVIVADHRQPHLWQNAFSVSCQQLTSADPVTVAVWFEADGRSDDQLIKALEAVAAPLDIPDSRFPDVTVVMPGETDLSGLLISCTAAVAATDDPAIAQTVQRYAPHIELQNFSTHLSMIRNILS